MSNELKPNITKVRLKDASTLPFALTEQVGMVLAVEPFAAKRPVSTEEKILARRIVTVKFGTDTVCTPVSNLTIVT